MSLLRFNQYLQRFIHVYIFYIVGQAQARKMKVLEELYQHSVDFLNQTGKEYWLDFGTLLGYHREGRIIPHDIDVDFGLHEKSYEIILNKRHLINPRMKFYNSSHRHRGPKLYFSYKGFDADLYFYEDLGIELRNYENTKWPNERRVIPKALIYPLTKVDFLSKKVTVPFLTKEYLEYIYGYLGANAKRDQETGVWIKDETIN